MKPDQGGSQVSDRWVNAVVDFVIPLRVDPDASRAEKLQAAGDATESTAEFIMEQHGCAVTVQWEDVTDGELTDGGSQVSTTDEEARDDDLAFTLLATADEWAKYPTLMEPASVIEGLLREAASHIEHLEAQVEAADELARVTALQTALTPRPGTSEIQRRRALNVYQATRNPKEEG